MFEENLPRSIAIAGAWGYIGRKFLDAAVANGIDTYVFDPGPVPEELDCDRFRQVGDARDFYETTAELFHLALHPEDRATALEFLANRQEGMPPLILNEKPMTSPATPQVCARLVRESDRAQSFMLFDFPELFDSLTLQICNFLESHDHVKITEVCLQRSKDREDPGNSRNYKRMVPIQYQESVHCLAYVLFLLGRLDGSLAASVGRGGRVAAKSELYQPPNPEAYCRAVDGRCEFRLQLGEVDIKGLTNFKRGAVWSKERVIKGVADGRPFAIEVDYLEKRKRLTINGVSQKCDPKADSYGQVIETAWRWRTDLAWDELMLGVYPNPRFAHAAYQLSSLLWRASQDGEVIGWSSLEDVMAFDAGFDGR